MCDTFHDLRALKKGAYDHVFGLEQWKLPFKHSSTTYVKLDLVRSSVNILVITEVGCHQLLQLMGSIISSRCG